MSEQTTEITITPDPQILQVLSYLEMKPQDSLCELIDNSIDALNTNLADWAPIIAIDLPSRREAEEGTAILRVRDNGPGMTLEQVQDALRAGYSSKPRYGSLGLFGVGFNIATGKLGRTTTLITTRDSDDFAIKVEVDLINLRKAGNFKVSAKHVAKPPGLRHGTVVEVSQPWGPANQNYNFMSKLVSIGRPKLLRSLGRVYGTVLRTRRVKILLGDMEAVPFEHCVWDDKRHVEHLKWGKIHAVFRFDNKVIHSYVKCADCGAVLPAGHRRCLEVGCGSESVLTQEERISGWVGVQRYSDASHYGIDLIRNGRAIRLLEKAAFFDYEDPITGDPIHDYPIDQNEGRIVGELHLNHVPVDPAKQNFERSSPEWRRAIEFVRGTSSLQPERPGADTNRSPIFMLYQGYRKVRGAGHRSMTMGKWEPGRNEAKQLSKDEIEDLKSRFEKRELGYFDDSEWWKLVEQADAKPVAGLIKCKDCHLESPESADECIHCGNIFEGKRCLNCECGVTIKKTAVTCPECGANQIPEIQSPWKCQVCKEANGSESIQCENCDSPRGTTDPLSREALQTTSEPNEDLSIVSLSIKLANGEMSSPVTVQTHICTKSIIKHGPDGQTTELPSIRFVGNEIEIFIDARHYLTQTAGVSLEEQVAYEVASYLYGFYQSLSSHPDHSVSNLAHKVLSNRWGSQFGTLGIESELALFFSALRQKLAQPVSKESSDVFMNLSQEEQSAIATALIRSGRDIVELASMKENGEFVFFLRPKGILEIFRINPKLFFDGNVWNVTYARIDDLHLQGSAELQGQIRREYGGLLEVACVYVEKGVHDLREAAIAEAACRLLSEKIA